MTTTDIPQPMPARPDYFQMVPRLYGEIIRDPISHRLLAHYASYTENYESVGTTARAIGVSASTVRRRRKILAATPARAWLPDEYQRLVPESDTTPLITLGGLARDELHPQWGTRYVYTADVWALNHQFFEHRQALKLQAKTERATRGGAVAIAAQTEAVATEAPVPDAMPISAMPTAWATVLQQSSVVHLLEPFLKSADAERVDRFVAAYLYAQCNHVDVGGTFKSPVHYALKQSGKTTATGCTDIVQRGPEAVATALHAVVNSTWGQATDWPFPAKATPGQRAGVARLALAELGLLSLGPSEAESAVIETVVEENEPPAVPEEIAPELSKDEQVWAAARTLLRNESPQCAEYLNRVALIELRGTTAVLSAHERYVYDWASNRLDAKLRGALSQASGQPIEYLSWQVKGEAVILSPEYVIQRWLAEQTYLPAHIRAFSPSMRLTVQAEVAVIVCATESVLNTLRPHVPQLERLLTHSHIRAVQLTTATSPP